MSTDLTDDDIAQLWAKACEEDRTTAVLVSDFARRVIAEDRNRRASSAAAVPGWKLVPVEPTREMLKAVDDEAEDKYLARGRAVSAWKSMLAATPAPPQAVPATDAERLLDGLKFAREYARKLPANTGYLNAMNAIESAIDWLSAAPVAVDAAPELADEDIETMLPVIRHMPGCINYAVYAFGDVAFAVRAALRAVGAGSREPLTEEPTDEAINAAVDAWFDSNAAEDCGSAGFSPRMRAAIRAARGKA